MIAVNQTRPQPAAEIASPVVAPMQLVMPVTIGGYGYGHHFHHYYDCGTAGLTSLEARIAVGHRGGGREDAALSVGTDAAIDSGYD